MYELTERGDRRGLGVAAARRRWRLPRERDAAGARTVRSVGTYAVNFSAPEYWPGVKLQPARSRAPNHRQHEQRHENQDRLFHDLPTTLNGRATAVNKDRSLRASSAGETGCEGLDAASVGAPDTSMLAEAAEGAERLPRRLEQQATCRIRSEVAEKMVPAECGIACATVRSTRAGRGMARPPRGSESGTASPTPTLVGEAHGQRAGCHSPGAAPVHHTPESREHRAPPTW